ncbi:MAG: N-acetyl-gamma-glutamyl-phosphate reductase [Actinobacteria bacterium]|nr:N-acetyl-gamma-glutamyl-phosphate reductase [Actinomycetota bacterium]
MGTTAAVLGASGYAGGELLRILEGHDGVEVIAAAASSKVGTSVAAHYPGLASLASSKFIAVDEALACGADVVFASMPHTESMALFGGAPGSGVKVIDLGGDFRLTDPQAYARWYGSSHSAPDTLASWVYGLTEWNRQGISSASLVANPGCYAAASLLALGPFVEAGMIDTSLIRVSALSGVSGAGRATGSEGLGLDFASMDNNSRAYGVTGHKHIAEIEEQLALLAGPDEVVVGFTPHLVPMVRGIVTTCTAPSTSASSTSALISILRARYADEPFIRVIGEEAFPETKRLNGTNLVEVTARFDEHTGGVIAIAAIDNLGKGAAGQAVQNMNLMFGFPETTALVSTGLVP